MLHVHTLYLHIVFVTPLGTWVVASCCGRKAILCPLLFSINGEGSRRSQLEGEVADLDNVTLVDFQPKDRLAEVLAAGDVHLVLLREGLASVSVPSKMYSVLAAGRPVLASVDPGTEVDRVISGVGAGEAVPAGDVDAFCAAVESWVDDAARRSVAGAAGRRFAESWLSADAVAGEYSALFVELTES